MAIIADFMLVWLPAPTVSLRAPVALNAGRIAKFFHNCPDNAFQVSIFHLYIFSEELYIYVGKQTSRMHNNPSLNPVTADSYVWNIVYFITENRCNSGKRMFFCYSNFISKSNSYAITNF